MPRKPAFSSTGAMVLRMMACSSGFSLMAWSAAATSFGSLLVARLRKCDFMGSALVSESVRKNSRVESVSLGLVSYSESLASARARVKMALSGRGMEE